MMDNYYIPATYFFKHVFGIKTISSKITNRTIELGNKYSPEFVCTPFKYTLGTFIECLESGANILIQPGGGCRYGYYYELQAKILKDLGYEFTMINLVTAGKTDYKKILKDLKKIGKYKIFNLIYRALISKKMVIYMDEIDDYIRKNIGFGDRNKFNTLKDKMLKDFLNIKGYFHLKYLYYKY